MVNGVLREGSRPNPEGPQAPRVLVKGLPDIFILLGSWLYMNVAAELLYIIGTSLSNQLCAPLPIFHTSVSVDI